MSKTRGLFLYMLGRPRVPADERLEYAEREPKITGTTLGKRHSFPASLEPALFLEKVEHVAADEGDNSPYHEVAVVPVELGHEFKIHTVNT